MERIIDQVLLQSDERIKPIVIRFMPLSDLTNDALHGIFAATTTSTDRIGLAGSFSNKATLNLLAFATMEAALVLQIPSKGGSFSYDLQDFFTSDQHSFYAFNAHILALSLFSDLQLTVNALVDLQSATPKNSARDIVTTAQQLLDDSSTQIYKDNFISLFQEDFLDADKEKNMMTLAQRAWIAHYLSSSKCAASAITTVPLINTLQWSTEVSLLHQLSVSLNVLYPM